MTQVRGKSNGISEASELKPLNVLGLSSIELDYKMSKKTDEFGNVFRYRAKLTDLHGAQMGRWAWDVFLVSTPQAAKLDVSVVNQLTSYVVTQHRSAQLELK